MISDKFFLWPYGMSLVPAIEYLKPLLDKSPLLKQLDDPAIVVGPLSDQIAIICRQWNINPAWVVVCFQREQSLIDGTHTPAQAVGALRKATGFVGQDVGTAALPGYYGVSLQVYRCVEQSAWLLGREPSDCWRQQIRTQRTVARFRPGLRVRVQNVPADIITGPRDNQNWADYAPITASEFLQLSYTPHWEVLDTNEALAKKYGAQFL